MLYHKMSRKTVLLIVGFTVFTLIANATFPQLVAHSMVNGLYSSSRAEGATVVSSLLWGENLTLDSSTLNSDWFLSNANIRSGLLNLHTQIIRFPVRGSNPSTSGITNLPELEQAAQDIKSMGLAPLVILRNPHDPALLADDSTVVKYMNSVFNGPGDIVYYEWGNEPDCSWSNCGSVDAATYVSSWNANIPKLKALATNKVEFIGPVSYQYDASYLQTFLQSANPLPDAISWHTYTCSSSQPEATCLANIDNWTRNFAAARSLMTSTIGKQLPIWDTEWNFDANVVSGDPKLGDSSFLNQWTAKALQTLANNQIQASMHFNVASIVPLVNSDGSATSEGQAFSDQYTTWTGGNGGTPTLTMTTTPNSTPTSTPTLTSTPTTPPTYTPTTSPTSIPTAPPTHTPAPAGGLKYSFEDGGLDGWTSTGHVSSLRNSTAVGGRHGTHALKVVFYSMTTSDWPYIHVNPSGGPSAGQTLTAYIYVSAGTSTTVTAKLYVQDSSYTWHIENAVALSQRGSWLQLSFSPSGYAGTAIQVGLQFTEAPVNTSTTIYVDSVNWG